MYGGVETYTRVYEVTKYSTSVMNVITTKLVRDETHAPDLVHGEISFKIVQWQCLCCELRLSLITPSLGYNLLLIL